MNRAQAFVGLGHVDDGERYDCVFAGMGLRTPYGVLRTQLPMTWMLLFFFLAQGVKRNTQLYYDHPRKIVHIHAIPHNKQEPGGGRDEGGRRRPPDRPGLTSRIGDLPGALGKQTAPAKRLWQLPP
uniref:Uncharacterized protein n=1 Tax=Coccidioides posadasii RMSCC 3488 TaxID=454284 RepID=A0A0J6I6Q6_COCPO|nr:hypothetical protein CPAG_03433 [Coccidioides posadasii RMSCC 3488]